MVWHSKGHYSDQTKNETFKFRKSNDGIYTERPEDETTNEDTAVMIRPRNKTAYKSISYNSFAYDKERTQWNVRLT